MSIRYIMLGVIGFIVAGILSVVLVQNMEGSAGDSAVTPPDPLVATPEKAAEGSP